MARSLPLRALLPLAIVAVAGCQDYNFNPVGHCLIQPGTERVQLSDLSTADVLFVVDDSGSMGGEQEKLAQNFAAFIANLDLTNKSRRSAGLEPIDFHVAVTTTSVFHNGQTSNSTTCSSACPGATSGALVCCETTTAGQAPVKVADRCASSAECGAGLECRPDCAGLLGESVCCDPTTKVAPLTAELACTTAGAPCGTLDTHYQFDGVCAPGNATNGNYYPHGAFVGLGDNPRVLHFDKELYPALDTAGNPIRDAALPACSDGSKICNRQGHTADQLKSWFASNDGGGWSGNVIAGTCGSGQEQGLQAAKLAVQKAIEGKQVDTRDVSGQPASAPAAWLHDRSKLVLVFVGDEDDCSSPEDASGGVILSGAPGADSCFNDANLPADQRKQFGVAGMVDYFAGLGRPMGAAFIVSTSQSVCQDDACTPGQCCDTQCTGSASTCRTSICGGQGPGVRLLEAANAFKGKGADTVVGSMCDPNFGSILDRIAEIVKPPSGLVLPTQPAGSDIVLLRIANAKGETRKTCRGPAPAGMTVTDAKAAGYDWWFTGSDQQSPSTVSRSIFINHDSGNCEANPGETYSADYLGRIPAGGCQTRAECYSTLGGTKPSNGPEVWTCYAGESAPGVFIAPTLAAPGTCICGDPGAGSF